MGTGTSAPEAVNQGSGSDSGRIGVDGGGSGSGLGSHTTLTDRVKGLDSGNGDRERKLVVPTQFRWPYGGQSVYIAGSFNDWKGKVPMKLENRAPGSGSGVATRTSGGGDSGASAEGKGGSRSRSGLPSASASASGSGSGPAATAGGAAGAAGALASSGSPGAATNSAETTTPFHAATLQGRGQGPNSGPNDGKSTDQPSPVFTITLDLPPGTHYYKFIVDDRWQYDPGEERMTNHAGVVNNVIEVKRPGAQPSQLDAVMGNPESYGQEMPRDFASDPPPLPPQLTHLHLNHPNAAVKPTTVSAASGLLSGANAAMGSISGSASHSGSTSRTAPKPPLHVTLNHVCFQKSNPTTGPNTSNTSNQMPDLLVVGVTQRYRAKGLPQSKDRFITTICYKPRLGLAT